MSYLSEETTPSDVLEVLKPLKVGDGHTTSVAENVGKEADSLGQENLLGGSRGRAIGGLDDELTLEFICVVSVDGLFEGSRDEEVARL